MCEVINAEISIGTINSLSDAIGYLKWTFYSRRVKMNPSYYGAKSSSEEDLEDFYLSVVNATISRLKDEGCIVVNQTEGTDWSVVPTPLGRACSNFYLLHHTPMQMKKSITSLKQVLSRHTNGENNCQDMPINSFINKDMAKRVKAIQTFVMDYPIYTYAVAHVLYGLSSTHGMLLCFLASHLFRYSIMYLQILFRPQEYDELPVRHNEEELNLELSKLLPWGHDLSKVSFWTEKTKHPGNLLDIMLDPHTKCFLLLQVSKSVSVFRDVGHFVK